MPPRAEGGASVKFGGQRRWGSARRQAEPDDPEMAGSGLSFGFLALGSAFIYLDALLPITQYNFHISDILFAASFFSIFLFPGPRRRFAADALQQPLLWCFAGLAVVWVVGLGLAGINGAFPDESSWVLGVLQLAFIFFLLAPTMFFHAQIPRRHRLMWTIQAVMIAFAGLISLTEYLGITHLQVQSYYRVVNPLRGLNGLYVFGLVSAFLLQSAIELFPRPRTWAYLALWLLGFFGIALGVIRLGLVLTAFSLAAVAWSRRAQILQSSKVALGLILMVGAAVLGGAYLAFRALPGFQDRIQFGNTSAGIWYIADRLRVASVAWGRSCATRAGLERG